MNGKLIGICIRNDSLLKLTTARVRRYSEKYPDSEVAFICFYIHHLNIEKQEVTGLKYQKETGTWEKGVFSIPDVVFIQGFLGSPMIKKLESVVGANVFNNFLFDKWEGWEFLAKSKNIKKYLPHTEKLNKQELLTQIDQFKNFVLKPVMGSSSSGIVMVRSREHGAFEVSYPLLKDIISLEFATKNDLCDWMTERVKLGTFIIQKMIPTMKYQNKVVDIRLNMNKNGVGRWDVSLLLFRVASNNLLFVPRTMKRAYTLEQFDHDSVFPTVNISKLEKDIHALGYRICQAFDAAGYHMADLGIDLGLDENGHLWIFEVNHIPYPGLGSIEDHSVIRPLEYGVYLANKMK